MFLIVLVMMPFVASSCNNADETLPVKTTMQIDFIKNYCCPVNEKIKS